MTARETPPKYLPTPAQIAKACERIREGWTEREHLSRRGIRWDEDDGWTPPEVSGEIQEPWRDE